MRQPVGVGSRPDAGAELRIDPGEESNFLEQSVIYQNCYRFSHSVPD